MTVEILKDADDKKAKIVCPACRGIIVINLVAYEQDATKPILSNCPYCGAGIFSCILLFASRDLKQLQAMINEAVAAVGAHVSKDKVIVDGKVLKGKVIH